MQALYDAYKSGAITSAELSARLSAMSMANAGSSAGLGTLGSGLATSQVPTQQHYNALLKAHMLKQQMLQMQNSLYARAVISAPHSPTSLKSEGMRAGEIIAWRAWHIKDDNLLSVVAEGKTWSATEPMVGNPAAGYGVHAYKSPHGPVLDSYVTREHTNLWVIGEVAMWGDVIEHADGYRSEFARVHSFVTWADKVPAYLRTHMSKKYLEAMVFKPDDVA
jgi:hypothetical protein